MILNEWLILGLSVMAFLIVDRICTCIEKNKNAEKTNNDKNQYYR